jgi:hypothetical protein
MPPALRRSSPDLPELNEPLSLASQWALPFNGPSVSTALLTRLISVTEAEVDSSDREEQRGETSRRSSGSTSSNSSVFEDTEHANPDSQMGGPTLGKNSQAAFQPAVSGGMEETMDEVESSIRIKPPTVTPSLPPLIPSRMLNREPSPAAVSIQQETKQARGVTETEDDLNELAIKIERILNEEARRHGIDV